MTQSSEDQPQDPGAQQQQPKPTAFSFLNSGATAQKPADDLDAQAEKRPEEGPSENNSPKDEIVDKITVGEPENEESVAESEQTKRETNIEAEVTNSSSNTSDAATTSVNAAVVEEEEEIPATSIQVENIPVQAEASPANVETANEAPSQQPPTAFSFLSQGGNKSAGTSSFGMSSVGNANSNLQSKENTPKAASVLSNSVSNSVAASKENTPTVASSVITLPSLIMIYNLYSVTFIR